MQQQKKTFLILLIIFIPEWKFLPQDFQYIFLQDIRKILIYYNV